LEEEAGLEFDALQKSLSQMRSATWNLSNVSSQPFLETMSGQTEQAAEDRGNQHQEIVTARHLVLQEVMVLPDLVRTVLGEAYQVLLQMNPVYIGFVSSLADVPIELAGDPPLGTRFAVGRLAGPDLTSTCILVTRAALGEDIDRPAAILALVAEAWNALPEKPLPEARREAEAIYNRLTAENDIRVRYIHAADGMKAFLNEVQTVNLVHFAGHGEYDGKHPDYSGLVFRDGVLAAKNLRTPLAGSPIVFSNACETGRLSDQELAQGDRGWQGLAASFITQGAINYLGSLWPIVDDSSRRVAESFYMLLCQGVSVGEALRQARLQVYRGNDTTWAAFALFGCPRNRIRAT
jgi:hypothetical protein